MRSIWSGVVSFGLIYIPVRLYNASQSRGLSFNLLRRSDLCPIRYARICEETGEEVPYEDIVKGYEYEKGEYVVLEEEDFKRASIRKAQMVEILNFVDASEIDAKFMKTPYYLEPIEEAKKIYALLREALKKSGKVGIARFVLRSREHLAILKAEDDVILLDTIRFVNEIRQPDELELPEKQEISSRELDMAVQLISQLTEPWNPEQYHDTYVEDLKRIIQDKIQGKELEEIKEEPIPIEVTDIFAKLNESLQMAKERSEQRQG